MNKSYLVVRFVLALSIVVAFAYANTPTIATVASTIAFIAFMVESLYAHFDSAKLQKLNSIESTERSLLSAIRHSVSTGLPVGADAIGASLVATKEAENKYREIYGFHRPEFAISVKTVFCGADWSQVKDSDSGR